MRTTMPVVLAVLVAMSGILAVGGISIMRAYTQTLPTPQANRPLTPQSTVMPSTPSGQQPNVAKLTPQPPANQTCTGDDCSHGDGGD